MPQARRSRHDAVGAVRADEEGRTDARVSDACPHFRLVDLDLGDGGAIAEVGARRRSLLGEMEVEASPLRHVDEPCIAPASDLPSVPRTDDDPVDDVLDDRIDRAGNVPQRASGQPSAAGLVAREPCLVHQQHACTRTAEVDRGR